MSKSHILVVDDEPDILQVISEILQDEGYSVSTAPDAETAREIRRQRRPDLILLDIWLPGMDGLELLREWSEESRLDAPVIMMSGHGNVETAVEATHLGAYDFLEKPISLAKLQVTVRRALEAAALERENLLLREGHEAGAELVGESEAITRLREQAQRLAAHDTAVLIQGEPGTGKELVARYVHRHGPRAEAPFIPVNLAGLARENPAAELFGSEDGDRVHYGHLERAAGGTLLLKDIADLDMELQGRLLTTLEQGTLLRVGGREPVPIDVRIIAATRHDLQQRVAAGSFRDDLYYQLSVVPLTVPPLREHKEDIPLLVEHFTRQFSQRDGLAPRQFESGALGALQAYDWPGNVSELRNLVQRLLILGTSPRVDTREVRQALGLEGSIASEAVTGPVAYDLPLRQAREQFERAYFEYQLRKTGGNVSRAAENTGIERTHLYRKLRQLGLDPKEMKRNR
ncbi:MAG: sigma-54-dependent Fis family transcriptional regulator [Gammaproteobacteria bacterium]|nr:MAG: sigma-54-dependent Fis family transcriptional regulator [Gammaproteobacteria bacterium]